MRAGRPRSRGCRPDGEVGGIRRATSLKAGLSPLGNSRLPASRAPVPPRLGRSIEKDYLWNIDAQDAQDNQDGRLLHETLTRAMIACGFEDVREHKPAVSGKKCVPHLPQGFPCCCLLPLPCVPASLPRRKRIGARVALFPIRQRPSPKVRRVGFRIVRFEACSTFTRVPARMVAAAHGGPFHQSASVQSLPPWPALAATNRIDSCWAGFAPARRRRLSTAHWPFVDYSFFFCFRQVRGLGGRHPGKKRPL